MIVTMLKTTQGSRNGITVETYKEGEEYDLPKHLIDAFLVGNFIAISNEDKEQAAPKKEEFVIKLDEVPINKKATVPSNKTTKKGR